MIYEILLTAYLSQIDQQHLQEMYQNCARLDSYICPLYSRPY